MRHLRKAAATLGMMESSPTALPVGRLAHQSASMNPSTIRHGEFQIATGVACLMATVVLFRFVMIGLLAIPMFPVALGTFLTGLIRARNNNFSGGRQVASFLLLMGALTVLLVANWCAVELAREYALLNRHPTQSFPPVEDWLRSSGVCIASGALMAFGLWLWTDWSRIRRRFWGVCVMSASPAAFVSYRVLAQWLPIEA